MSDIANENWDIVLRSAPGYLIDGVDYDLKDIYNYKIDNGSKAKKSNAIGF